MIDPGGRRDVVSMPHHQIQIAIRIHIGQLHRKGLRRDADTDGGDGVVGIGIRIDIFIVQVQGFNAIASRQQNLA